MYAHDRPADIPATGSFHVPRKPISAKNREDWDPAQPTAHTKSFATTSLLSPSEEEEWSQYHRSRGRRASGKQITQSRYIGGWWWWWEIGGCLVSIVGCGLLVFVLTSVDQTSRASWTHALEPNAVLAIISTISRTAMMVPVGSCLSQLKWRHFRRRSHPLSHLDIIDRSSRGPWGSVELLFRLGRANIVLSMLAITTILSLAVGPTVQQILETDTREVKLDNVTADVAFATAYTSMAGAREPDISHLGIPLSGKQFEFFSNIVRGLSEPIQPSFSCQSERCSWPTFTALGFCANVANLTEEVTRECSQVFYEREIDDRHFLANYTWAINCTLTPPRDFRGGPRPEPTFEWTFHNTSSTRWDTTPDYLSQPQYLRTFIYFSNMEIPLKDDDNENMTSYGSMVEFWTTPARSPALPARPPPFSFHRVFFYFCAQTFSGLTATPDTLSSDVKMTTEPLNFTPTANVTGPYSYKPYEVPSTGDFVYVEEDTDTAMSIRLFPPWLESASASAPNQRTIPTDTSPGPWIWHNGVQRAADNIATSISSLIRSQNLGDNMNATVLSGEAFRTEVYFNVRWPWMSLVVAETLCITVLLAVSIWLSWRDSLAKDSVFAFLIHGLEGWSGVHAPRPENTSSLDDMSKNMRAKLERDDDGVLRFRRQDA